jgi:nitronate monooxygenase
MPGTRFTKIFGFRHPVKPMPMALHSCGTLVAAVSAAGGSWSSGGVRLAT